MTVDARHDRVRELFLAVRELAPANRDAELLRLCGGDETLRTEVVSLLAYRDETQAAATAEPLQSDAQLRTGELFAGRYRIIVLLGRGGMGEVYRAHDTLLDVPVALKLLRARGPESRERLLNEVRLARGINHATVCRVFDVGEWQGQAFFTMEYIPGEDLHTMIRRLGRLPAERVVQIGRQLCAGLTAAHGCGVLHRDLKPANIMIDDRGRVRITDFGIATLDGDDHGRIEGTPGYMAPEQLSPGAQVSPRSDCYAAGLVLYELLTGQPAFATGETTTVLRRQLRTRPVPPSALISGIPEALERVVLDALERDPERRPPSALAMAAGLPGVNPLALAAEAGMATPSELLRSDDGSLPSWLARCLLLAVLVLLAVLADNSDEQGSFSRLGPHREPALVAEHAAGLLRRLGHQPSPGDASFGLMNDPRAGSGDAVLLWYREPATPAGTTFLREVLLPGSVFSAEVLGSGGVLLLLDHDERLVYFHRHAGDPRPISDDNGMGITDWPTVLELAGLDASHLRSVPPERPAGFASELVAWQGTGADGRALRVDAAADNGLPVLLAVRPFPEFAAAEQTAQQARLRQEQGLLMLLLILFMGITALVLAWRNLRRQRARRTQARRVAFVVAACGVLGMLLAPAGHPLDTGIVPVLWGCLGFLLLAGMSWLLHLAAEPAARHDRPQGWQAWERLLAGKAGDPMVGRVVLVGAAAGALLALVGLGAGLLGEESGTSITLAGVPAAQRLSVGLAWTAAVSAILRQLPYAITACLVQLLCLVLLTRWLRREWLVALTWISGGTVLAVVAAGASWGSLLVGLVGASLALILLRLTGPLGLATASYAHGILAVFPITDNFDSWYGGSGLLALVLVAVLAAAGYLTARQQRALPAG